MTAFLRSLSKSVLYHSFLIILSATGFAASPRVFVLTDINLVGGDPDDRQSLVHLLWYANELEIEGIVPDRWNGKGHEACQLVIDAYAKDYQSFRFSSKGYPSVEQVNGLIAKDEEDAIKRMVAAVNKASSPLYVLVWGSMKTLQATLFKHPDLVKKIRVLSIGTGLKYGPRDEVPGEFCNLPNWNGPGRDEIYEDSRFDDLWWVESNWTYNGMFVEPGPSEMFEKLSEYGKLGAHLREATAEHPWAQYFRVGDTPSVLYLIDPSHDVEDPTQSSWAGKFKQPFPDSRPGYFTDDNVSIDWDYAEPCNTWENLEAMYAYNKSTLVAKRAGMYRALLEKLEEIYRK